MELFKKMQERGVEPDVITWNAAISACEKGGQWERAMELFQKMQERRVVPNVITWSAAISACEKSGAVQEAIELFLIAQRKGCYDLWNELNTEYDLHNLSISVAKIAVGSLLEDIRLRPQSRHFHEFSKQLIIVTGRGNNSEGNVALLRPAVIDFLNSIYPELESEVDVKNDGRVLISADSLTAWAASSMASSSAIVK